VTLDEMPKEVVDPWCDPSRQPRCNLCGRFAYWDKDAQRWMLRCVGYDPYSGGWEHE